MRSSKRRLLAVVLLLPLSFGSGSVLADDPAATAFVPQTLLQLIHAPEVQKELGLQPEDEKLLAMLREIDAPWWRSRNLPADEQQGVVAELEKQFLARLKGVLTADQIKRLRQLEAQSQGTRAILRTGIAKAIGLNEKQRQALQKICSETDRVARKLQSNPDDRSAIEQELATARDAEQQKVNELLDASHRVALGRLIGKPFDTTSLKRIYPLAPELIDSGEWTGGTPTTLADHRGKVVLVHFYAFQCHNCVANFDHYNRWQQEWADQGVTVIGIQTPETTAERDVTLVRIAAKEKGFEFPVLIDLYSKNWEAWGNTMWPTVYVVDKNGYIRSWWQGELNWQGATGDKTIEQMVAQLQSESP